MGEITTRYRINEFKRDGTVERGRNLWDEKTALGFCDYLRKEHTGKLFFVVPVKCKILSNGSYQPIP